MALFGDSIRGLHVLTALVASLATACGVFLARRFTRHAPAAVVLVLLSPSVLPVANLMVDLPVLAVSLAAVAVFVRAVDGDRGGLAVLGGLLAGLAILTKYNAVVLVPLLALYALLRHRIRYLYVLAIPAAMVLLWCLHNVITFGDIHLRITADFQAYPQTPETRWSSFYSAALVPGASFLFLGVLGLARLTVRGRSILLPLGAIMLLGPSQMWWWRTGGFIAAEYWAFAINTLLLLAFASAAPGGLGEQLETSTGKRNLGRLFDLVRTSPDPSAEERWRDDLFLWLWVGGVVLFQVLFAHHQAPRYHILALPPLALLLVRTVDAAVPIWRSRHHAVVWGSAGLGLLVALFVAAADDAHARPSREYPSRVALEHDSDGGEIFCVGHWGLQYYCDEQGFTQLDALFGEIREGDLFIVPENSFRNNLPKAMQPLPTGRPVCPEGRRLLELVQKAEYPPDPESARLPAEAFFGTRLLAAFHRVWPFSVSPMHGALLYSANVPAPPYSWRPRRGAPEERFMLLRARCDYALSGESFELLPGTSAGRVHLVSGWGAPLPLAEPEVRGSWNVGSPSRFAAVLDHRQRDYVMRVSGLSVRHPEARKVQLGVIFNGHQIGSLDFTPELDTRELLVPAEVLAWENDVVFVFSYLEHPVGEPARAIFFTRIELAPVDPGAAGPSGRG